MPSVLRAKLAFLCLLGFTVCSTGQQPEQQPDDGRPKVRVSYLNVCQPSSEEQNELKAALTRISLGPKFVQDFEVARGRSSMEDAPASYWVRVRREFTAASPFSTAQYSISTDEKSTIEVLVFRLKDAKDLLQIILETSVTAGAVVPSMVVAMDSPVRRIKLERFGKSSVVLARCEGADQSGFKPVFDTATDLLARYRVALGLRDRFRRDVAWLDSTTVKPPTTASKRKR